jgi:effector-binding domain-containing protein
MPGKLAGGSVLYIDYYGAYSGTGEAHYLIEEYAKENGITIGAPAVEMYVTDPKSEPDTAKWLTKVLYPITQ